MKYLIDTHVFLWFINGNPELRGDIIELIADTDNDCYLSIVSVWEIAIKVSLRKLEMAIPFHDILSVLEKLEIEMLPISFEDINIVKNLEFHHRDPFDRMIIAQSIRNGMSVITKDENFTKYGTGIISI